MLSQDKIAGFATLVGAILLTIAVTMAAFLLQGFVPPFIVVVLPAILGTGLLVAGLLYKGDSSSNSHD